MRILVFFDLPVVEKVDRRRYATFHKFLIKDGYSMLQYSVYSRIVQNHDDAHKYIERINRNKPAKGSVRVLQVTEKQYASMIILVGEKTKDEDFLAPKDILEI